MASTEDSRTRRWLQRLLVSVLAPAICLVLVETVLALCGVSVPRYDGFGDPGRYWIPWQAEGQAAGFTRVRPRSYRHVPEQLPLFLAGKPARGYRVFVLGESSVKGDPYETGCFTDWLRLRLTAMLPDRAVEVVNAGNPGWHATDVRLLLQECLEHQPDLLVWMVGHNEFVPHNVLTLREELLSPVRHALRRAIGGLRALQWLQSSLDSHRSIGFGRRSEDGRPVYGPELELLKRRFRQATEGAVADARAAGVPIVLCTMPRNVRTWPPAISCFSEALAGDPALRARWDQLYEAAQAAIERGDGAAALAELDRAEELDATPAKLHFERGRALALTGADGPARAAFLRALELDGGPMRAQDWIEADIREIAAAGDAPLVDLQSLFDASGRGGLAGNELLTDNCHPNLAGHELIASEILRVLEQQLGLPLDRSRDVEREAGRKALGITAQQDLAARQAEALNLVRLALQHSTVKETWDAAHQACLDVLAQDPEDGEVGGGLGLLEAVAGNAERARELIDRAMAANPHLPAAYVFYWKTQPPYQQAFAAAGLDMAAVEAALPPEQRAAVENRMRRAGTR